MLLVLCLLGTPGIEVLTLNFEFCVFAKLTRPDVVSGEGNGNPLQYSCLENPMDGGAWWAAVHWVARSRTRLKRLSSSSSSKGLSRVFSNTIAQKQQFFSIQPSLWSNSHIYA